MRSYYIQDFNLNNIKKILYKKSLGKEVIKKLLCHPQKTTKELLMSKNTIANCTQNENLSNPQNSYSVFCPSKLLEDNNLSDQCKITFLMISNFLNRDGYAICSDQWLADKRNLDIRNTKRHLEELEEKKYIYRETWKEGMYWKRRIWLVSEYAKYLEESGNEDPKFKKYLRKGKNAPFEGANLRITKGQKRPHNIKAYNNKETNNAAAVSSSKNTEKIPIDKKTTLQEKEGSLPFDLPLFHPKRKYLKGIAEQDMRQVQLMYEKAKSTIKNPEAWITACIRGKWYHQHQITDEDLTKNYQFSQQLEEGFRKAYNNPMMSLGASSKCIFLQIGENSIPMPSYEMNHNRFKENVLGVIKEKAPKTMEFVL